jgi:Bacteriophage holin family
MRGLVSDTTLSPVTTVYPLKLHATLLSALARLEDAPAWAWILGVAAGAWQYVSTSTFTQLLFLVVAASVADFWFGRKSARFAGQYDPRVAHMGAVGKAAGLVILLLIRLVEGWLFNADWIDSRGALATMVGMALVAVDLQSMAHHREALGATPIPVLSHALAWFKSLAATRVPAPPPTDRDPT